MLLKNAVVKAFGVPRKKRLGFSEVRQELQRPAPGLLPFLQKMNRDPTIYAASLQSMEGPLEDSALNLWGLVFESSRNTASAGLRQQGIQLVSSKSAAALSGSGSCSFASRCR